MLSRHGHDLIVKLETSQPLSKKKRRMVHLARDSFGMDEEHLFQRLHTCVQDLSQQSGKSVVDLADVFMRVSGDIEAVRGWIEGKRVVEWTYLEDLALGMAENSTEYRCLMTTKGRDEIEKRKRFLLNCNGGGQLVTEEDMS